MEINKKFLPKIAKFLPKKIRPTEEQLAIQLATQKFILIDANAGAAKTTTLALRMAESLMRGVLPEDMLALTITDAARKVMQERLKEIGVAASIVKNIRIASFEEFSRQVLLAIEGEKIPVIEENEQLIPVAIEALASVCQLYGGRFDIDANTNNPAINTFLNMQLGIKSRLDLKTHDFEGYDEEEIAHVLGVPLTTYCWHLEYEKLRGAGADADIQFRARCDASYDLVTMLEQEGCAHLLAFLPNCKMIICDELHDLNEVTFRLLTHLIAKNDAFFCGAGDKDQVIYSWTGADHQFLRTRFQQTFPRLATYPLTKCYRYGATLAAAVAHFKNKENQSGLSANTRLEVLTYAHRHSDDCANAVLAAIAEWQQGGGNIGGIAILLRNQSQSIKIENALIQKNLPYKTDGMGSFLHRLEILMFRGMMAIALQNLDTVKIKQVKEQIFDAMIVFAEINLTLEDFDTWKKDRDTAITQANALEWFLDGVLLRRSKNSREAIARCRDYLRALDPEMPAAEALQRVFDIMRLADISKRVFVDPQEAAVVSDSISEFIAMCAASGMHLRAFSQWLGDTEARLAQQKAKDAITIACVDAVKGREYDFVILPYLEAREFPRANIQTLEEENRFYVAITRSKTRLALLTPQAPEQRSGFIARMKLGTS